MVLKNAGIEKILYQLKKEKDGLLSEHDALFHLSAVVFLRKSA
jgi:hypothetical protein